MKVFPLNTSKVESKEETLNKNNSNVKIPKKKFNVTSVENIMFEKSSRSSNVSLMLKNGQSGIEDESPNKKFERKHSSFKIIDDERKKKKFTLDLPKSLVLTRKKSDKQKKHAIRSPTSIQREVSIHSETIASIQNTIDDNTTFVQIRKNLFEFLIRIAEKKDILNRWSCLILECFFFFQIMACSIHLLSISYLPTDIYKYAEYFLLFHNPVLSGTNFIVEVYVGMYILCASIVTVCFALLVYLYVRVDAPDMLYSFCAFFCRVIRTFFLYPLLHVFFSSFNCNFFDGSFILMFSPTSKCFDIPFFIFLFTSPIFLGMLFVICFLDCVFLIDKLKSVSYFTASSNGRFIFAFVLNLSIVTAFSSTLEVAPWGLDLIPFVYACITNVTLCFVYLRYGSYFDLKFSILFIITLSLKVGVYVAALWGKLFAGSPWCLFSLFTSLIIAIVLVSALITRIYVTKSLFEKKIYWNRFFSSCASDFTHIILLTLTDSSKMRKVIGEMIRNTEINKTKALCQELMSLTIESDVHVTHSVLNFSKSDLGNAWLDTDFFLYFYMNKIKEIQFSKNYGVSKVMKILSRTRKLEEKLKKLLIRFWGSFISNENKIDFSPLPTVIYAIQSLKTVIEKNYRFMIKTIPSKVVFDAYSRYLKLFMRDKKGAKINLRNALLFEEKESDLDSFSSYSNLTNEEEIHDLMNDEFGSPSKTRKVRSPKPRGRKGTSVNDSRRTTKLGASMVDLMKRKINASTFISSWTVLSSLLLLLVVGMSCLIASSILALELNSQYYRDYNLFFEASDLRIRCTGIAHYFRKVQTSEYPYPKTMLETERNSTRFLERAKQDCFHSLVDVKNLYQVVSSPWSSVYVRMIESVSYDPVVPNAWKNYTLFDGVNQYAEKCINLLGLSSGSYGNRTEGFRLEENSDFVFVTLNEPHIYTGLGKMLEKSIEIILVGEFHTILVFIIVPCVFLACSLPFIIAYVCIEGEKSRLFRGFRLISNSNALKMFEKFGGSFNDIGGRKGILGLKFSVYFKFVLSAVIFCLVFTLMLLTLTISAISLSSQLKRANTQYDYISRAKVHARRIHLWTVEVLYRDDTLFRTSEVLEGLAYDIDMLKTIIENVRFGNVELGITGVDSIPAAFSLFYDHKCAHLDEDEINELILFERLKCLSFLRQINVFIEAAEFLGNSNLTDTSLRGHNTYIKIIQMDDNENSEGVIQNNLSKLSIIVQESSQFYVSLLMNLTTMLIIIGIPSFILLFFIHLWPYHKEIQNFLKETKILMSHAPNEEGIFEFIMESKKFSKILETQKNKRVDGLCSILKYSYYPIVMFNSNLSIINFNKKCNTLFGSKIQIGVNFSNYFTPITFVKFVRWKKKTKLKNYNGEMVALNGKKEFPVLLDVSRHDKIYLAHIENIEMVKKREILAMVEKNNEFREDFLNNLLPQQLVAQVSDDDIHHGITATYPSCTAIFADLVNFTRLSKILDPKEMIEILNFLFSAIDDLSIKYEVEKIKTIGDCYFAVCGLPLYKPLHSELAMKFSIAIVKLVHEFNKKNDYDLHMRVGLAGGGVTAGIIGKHKWCFDCWGPAINLAARLESGGIPDKIQVCPDTYAALYDKYNFLERTIQIKGVKCRMKVYIHSVSLEDGFDGESLNILKKTPKKRNSVIVFDPSSPSVNDTKEDLDLNSYKMKIKDDKDSEELRGIGNEGNSKLNEEEIEGVISKSKNKLMIRKNVNMFKIEDDTETLSSSSSVSSIM